MEITKSVIVTKIRTAIDDILPTASDSFSADTDAELYQATFHAVQALLEELPLEMLDPSHKEEFGGDHTSYEDKSGEIKLPSDFLRFVSFRLNSWSHAVTELIEPGSDEEKRQSSKWSRGTVSKPRVMIAHGTDGALKLYYWVAGDNSAIKEFNYIPQAASTDTKITCALKDYTERMVIYRAASLFFEAKKENDIAEKFKALSIQ